MVYRTCVITRGVYLDWSLVIDHRLNVFELGPSGQLSGQGADHGKVCPGIIVLFTVCLTTWVQ